MSTGLTRRTLTARLRSRFFRPGTRQIVILSSVLTLRLAWLLVFPTLTSSQSPISVSKMDRSEEHTSELQSHVNLVCRLLLEKQKNGAHFHQTRVNTTGRTCVSIDFRTFYLDAHRQGIGFFFLMIRPPPRSTLFPYTTHFR